MAALIGSAELVLPYFAVNSAEPAKISAIVARLKVPAAKAPVQKAAPVESGV